jgi:GNAT superfamily N-acetyltransferase
MQYRSAASFSASRASPLAAEAGSRAPVSPRSSPVEDHGRRPCEVGPVGVEYLVRAARVTDIDRLVALSDASMRPERGESPLGAADLLRQLVYLPQASIFVAEARRTVVGGAILALRPSVQAGGYVGTVDLLVVDPAYDTDRISEALMEELLRSAANKGCTVVEAVQPDDPSILARWQGMGFAPASPLIQRTVTAAGVAARPAR